MKKLLLRTIILLAAAGIFSGCTRLAVNSLVGPTVENMQRQTDLELVCEGTPSFLLMLDSMIVSDPDNQQLLMTATQAYSSFASALEVCERSERAAEVSEKAKAYGIALLSTRKRLQSIQSMNQQEINTALDGFKKEDTPILFWSAYGWATWIRYQEGSPAALADLVRVVVIMQKVLELDESFYHGGAHLFLGAYYGAKPSMYGGKPELSRKHFEKALEISNREYLPTQVAYARIYAKITYNRTLYEQLLREAIDFPLHKRPDIALANQAAKRMAARMLAEVDEYF